MRNLPIALTIAGSDSGGGAGIQADLKTFAALGAHGTSVITCVTAQNPKAVLGISGVGAAFVRTQLEAVFAELPPKAVKTGMFYSADVVRTVREFFEALPKRRRPLIVVDPVMISTSGATLIEDGALTELVRLFEVATLITPNLDEAAALCRRPLRTPEDLRQVARELSETYGCAVLVKGGHLRGATEAIDFLADSEGEWILSAPFVRGAKTHGTGCTYAAAIAAGMARGMQLRPAVVAAKEYVTRAIAQSVKIGKHEALGWF
jgi:hydroxymethylpyrimidine/phosphomethylpyrimidine kinase